MRLLDTIFANNRDRRERDELHALHKILDKGRWKQEGVVNNSPFPPLARAILEFEGVFASLQLPHHPTAADTVQLIQLLRHLLSLQEGNRVEVALSELLAPLARSLPELAEGEDFGLTVSFLDRLDNPAAMIEGIVRTALSGPFQ